MKITFHSSLVLAGWEWNACSEGTHLHLARSVRWLARWNIISTHSNRVCLEISLFTPRPLAHPLFPHPTTLSAHNRITATPFYLPKSRSLPFFSLTRPPRLHTPHATNRRDRWWNVCGASMPKSDPTIPMGVHNRIISFAGQPNLS